MVPTPKPLLNIICVVNCDTAALVSKAWQVLEGSIE
jgi:hypothetical protein